MCAIVNRTLREIQLHRTRLYVSRSRRKKLTTGGVRNRLALLDYDEYMKDPAAYFLRKERWSLGG
ncbi:MAG: hypothetical protein PHN78_00995 [Dehalococcoidales bacterium]|nr:hypothetical protein [Dehalococcoidales bacterium]